MRDLAAVIVLALVACGDATGGGIDAPATGGDAAADAAGATGTVACGLINPMTCTAPAQACCDLPAPSNDLCYQTVGGICEGGQPVRCDGPEDCAGAVCCYVGGSSSCTSATACAAASGRAMCHDGPATGCAGGEACCSPTPGPTASPYGVCTPGGACPQ